MLFLWGILVTITIFLTESLAWECVSTGAVGAQTRRSLGHCLLHPQILKLLVLCIETRGFCGPELSSIEQTAPADPNS